MKDKTLYVVSGFMRTGTSMMMKALEAGGMEACYRQSREKMKQKFADEHYDPNVGGLYELEQKDYKKIDFPKGYEGKLIKGLNMCVPRMNIMSDGIRVVFMRRDSEEIRQSYNAFFDADMNVKGLDEKMENIIERIKNRKDVRSVNVLWYHDVIKNPQDTFKILQQASWPIDVQKCVKVVDPRYYRFKKEKLTIGI